MPRAAQCIGQRASCAAPRIGMAVRAVMAVTVGVRSDSTPDLVIDPGEVLGQHPRSFR